MGGQVALPEMKFMNYPLLECTQRQVFPSKVTEVGAFVRFVYAVQRNLSVPVARSLIHAELSILLEKVRTERYDNS